MAGGSYCFFGFQGVYLKGRGYGLGNFLAKCIKDLILLCMLVEILHNSRFPNRFRNPFVFYVNDWNSSGVSTKVKVKWQAFSLLTSCRE